MNGVVVAGTRSGVGKTVATLAIVHALQETGRTVQPAKAGPDFIDPSHHEQVAGTPSRTLDCWLQGETGLRRNYYRGDGDVCVVEGVMGLYDGDASSTAMVATALDLPVVLVVDAKAGMESVAATALGFEQYATQGDAFGPNGESTVDVVGVVAQRAHGGRHEAGIRDALPDDLAYFGRIPPRDDLEIPDRHLGLELGAEAPLGDDALDAAATNLRTDRLLDVMRQPPRPGTDPGPERTGSTAASDTATTSRASPRTDRASATQKRVAVARDDAFAFAYPATIERLRARATVVPFSPIAGDALPACDGVYLPGGYPELHAGALADSPALQDVHAAATAGTPVLGECGGLLALTDTLTTTDGTTREMAGVLPADVTMHDRYQALDHVELTARDRTLTADAGESLHGHEFHYSSADVDADARFAFDVDRGDGIDDQRDGLTEYRTLGTYCHVHPESGAFDAFLDSL